MRLQSWYRSRFFVLCLDGGILSFCRRGIGTVLATETQSSGRCVLPSAFDFDSNDISLNSLTQSDMSKIMLFSHRQSKLFFQFLDSFLQVVMIDNVAFFILQTLLTCSERN